MKEERFSVKRLLLVACLALATAVPAAFASSMRHYTVNAGGTVLSNGYDGNMGLFRIDFHKGPGGKITYSEPATGLTFHSVSLQSVRSTAYAMKIMGMGMANGKPVHFTVIATDHPLGSGTFRIDWNHLAAHGGNVTRGVVRITQIQQ